MNLLHSEFPAVDTIRPVPRFTVCQQTNSDQA
jgi:hypothetical protein